MSEKYKIKNPNGIYFITLTTINWIDIFTKPLYKHAIIESLQYCQKNKGLKIHSYVLMTNHLHAIVSSHSGITLQETIRDFKKFTSKIIIRLIMDNNESRKNWMLKQFSDAAKRIKRGINYKFWQDGFHPVELDTNDIIDKRLEYIHQNPVQAEFVSNAEDYKYSSAIDYCEGKGEIAIDLIG